MISTDFMAGKGLTKWLLLGMLLMMALGNAGCSDGASKSDNQASQDKDGKEKEEEKAPIPVEVVSVERGDIQQTYRSITTLEAENDAMVVARSTGVLQDIKVEEGDVVKKGQLLAQLDVEQLTLEVAQIEATLNKLKRELERQRSLFQRNLGSSDALDRALFEYQSQQAQYKLSKLKLNYASIKAPMNGVIIERHVKPGNFIREGDNLFRMVDLNTLIAVLHLPEKELVNVRKGQPVLMDIDALGGEKVVGEIDRIRPAIDTDTGTFRVVAKLDNSEGKLRSGMFGKVEVVFDVHYNTLILARQAVITQDNRSHVFVAQDGKAIQTPVKLGFEHDGMVEVIEGLGDAAQVITTGQQILKHETKVEVVTEEADSGEAAGTTAAAH